jgi:5-methylthioadenosine/S-adenosylhomocysteine deaminase
VGRIAPGQRADLVLLSLRSAALAGATVTVPHLVQHAGPEAVTAVMVDGAWVLRDGRILAFDEAAVIDRAEALAEEVRATARPDVELADLAAPCFLTPGVLERLE